jgi:hypothetical protein
MAYNVVPTIRYTKEAIVEGCYLLTIGFQIDNIDLPLPERIVLDTRIIAVGYRSQCMTNFGKAIIGENGKTLVPVIYILWAVDIEEEATIHIFISSEYGVNETMFEIDTSIRDKG